MIDSVIVQVVQICTRRLTRGDEGGRNGKFPAERLCDNTRILYYIIMHILLLLVFVFVLLLSFLLLYHVDLLLYQNILHHTCDNIKTLYYYIAKNDRCIIITKG